MNSFYDSLTKVGVGLALGLALSISASTAHAMAGADRVAWPGQPVAPVAGWPAGALELVNDVQRTEGWNSWFSECCNDDNCYDFKIHDTGDANRLLKALAAIKATNLTVVLYSGKGTPPVAFAGRQAGADRAAARFSIGNQERVNEWYHQLKEVSPGVAGFPESHRYTNPPVALPPTLMLYVGSGAVDLKQLQVPAGITVTTGGEAAEDRDEAAAKAIKEFIANQNVKVGNSSLTQPPSNSPYVAWAERCLKDFESLKPGMTRAEVEAKFKLDGGLQGVSPVRFVHLEGGYFKVNVEFDFKRNAADQGRAIWAKDDKVTNVSKPYLERPAMD